MKRLSVLPLGCYAVMFAYACYVALMVGHWPYYAHPDPGTLGLRSVGYAVAITMIVGALSVILLPIGYSFWHLVATLKHRAVPSHRKWTMLYAIGAMCWILDYAALHGWAPWHSIISWLVD